MPSDQTPVLPTTNDKRMGNRLVDVHMHFLPESYREALMAAGIHAVDGGMPLPDWSESQALEAMDQLGVETAMLSITSPSVRFLQGQLERELCRKVNLAGASLVSRYPGRFGLFATLPLPDEQASLAEIAFALDELDADGFVIETNIRGIYLGDTRLARIFDELNRRSAVVFLHPTSPACFSSLGLGRPAPMIEFPMDTTRSVVDLLYSGTIRRCPNIKFIVPHGGGTLPVLAPRIASFARFPFVNPKPKDEAEVFELLASLYYDVVQSAHAAPLTALREIAPVQKLLFGTDWPFGNLAGAMRNIERLQASDLSDSQLAMIGRENALQLFPRLQGCGCGSSHVDARPEAQKQ